MPTTRSQTKALSGVPGPDVHPAGHLPHKKDRGEESAEKASEKSINSVRLPARQGSTESLSEVPPIFTIDLSLPPDQRYVEVARAYKDKIANLTHLFDDLLEEGRLPKRLIRLLARILLRKLYSHEQTEELRGICKVTGLDMYLLVALNVLLDLFMGCTSGGMRIKEGRKEKMAHFRCLDWSMDELRDIVVQFEFVESPGGKVIATTINYVGYVGVLTGVRKGLSMSLNFRPYHNNDSDLHTNLRFRLHQLLVLTGFRESISSQLRHLLIPSKQPNRPAPPDLAEIMERFPGTTSTPCYLIFSSSTQTVVMEKDLTSAGMLSSPDFITVTNHDIVDESRAAGLPPIHRKKQHGGIQMDEIIDESIERKGCMTKKWEDWCSGPSMRWKGKVESTAPDLKQLIEWVKEFPVSNEMTHFSTIMDPETGTVVWKVLWRPWESDDSGEEAWED
jgi:hypothetical protein